MSSHGVLHALHLFPVKSVPGLSPASCLVDVDGLVGDRGYAVLDGAGAPLAAKHHPGLRDLHLAGPAHPPVLQVPGDLPLAEFLAVPGARLAAVSGGARQVEAVHLVTPRQRAAPDAGDSRRANLVVEFGDDEPEVASWVGATLVVAGPDGGGVELEVVGVPRHCAGVFARVVTPGELHVGDAVRLSVTG